MRGEVTGAGAAGAAACTETDVNNANNNPAESVFSRDCMFPSPMLCKRRPAEPRDLAPCRTLSCLMRRLLRCDALGRRLVRMLDEHLGHVDGDSRRERGVLTGLRIRVGVGHAAHRP